jgi:hypothetical protein
VSREHLGLPDDWDTVEAWSVDKPQFARQRSDNRATNATGQYQQKTLSAAFWDKFPSRKLPTKPTTKVNVTALKEKIREAQGGWDMEKRDKAWEAVKYLEKGAPAHQMVRLPATKQDNAASAEEHAEKITAALRDWVSDGVVAGPFTNPPVKDFRANCLMAVARRDKVRPVVHLSSPEGESFNDNVDKDLVMKVRMSSAAQFGQSVRAAGRHSRMSKLDMKDAYKLVPANPRDYRLQGVEWKGRLFVDTQQIFGAATAAANFDMLAGTVLELAKAKADIPEKLVHRTLDDVACVSPATKNWAIQFTETYRELAAELNIPLAPDCPNLEKSFTDSTIGTVLGVIFDTDRLSWRMPDHKAEDLLQDIGTFIATKHVHLRETQSLAGKVNHLAQMLPFLHAFKRPMNNLLGEFKEDKNILLPVTHQLVQDLTLIANAAITARDCRYRWKRSSHHQTQWSSPRTRRAAWERTHGQVWPR